jgi:hypothetical protein
MTKGLNLLPAWLAAALLLAGPALADNPGQCLVAENRSSHVLPLPHVAKAIAAKKLDILVMGTGSSGLPGPTGAKNAYPARLQAALSAALPGVSVKVTADVKSRRTAAVMLRALPKALAAAKPALLIWQTGTVDAMQAVSPDGFSDTLEEGIARAARDGADTVLVNSQYSPRTESMIALGTYSETMRWVALEHGVPLFNRFGVMRQWADLGTFELSGATNKLDTAVRVHDCLGRLLADLIIEGAKAGGPG